MNQIDTKRDLNILLYFYKNNYQILTNSIPGITIENINDLSSVVDQTLNKIKIEPEANITTEFIKTTYETFNTQVRSDINWILFNVFTSNKEFFQNIKLAKDNLIPEFLNDNIQIRNTTFNDYTSIEDSLTTIKEHLLNKKNKILKLDKHYNFIIYNLIDFNMKVENIIELKILKRSEFIRAQLERSSIFDKLNYIKTHHMKSQYINLLIDLTRFQDGTNSNLDISNSPSIDFFNHFVTYFIQLNNPVSRLTLLNYDRGQDVGGPMRDYISKVSNGLTSNEVNYAEGQQKSEVDHNTLFKYKMYTDELNNDKYMILACFNNKLDDTYLKKYELFGNLIGYSIANNTLLDINLHPTILYGILYFNSGVPHFINNLNIFKKTFVGLFKYEWAIKEEIKQYLDLNKDKMHLTDEDLQKEKQIVSNLKNFKLLKYANEKVPEFNSKSKQSNYNSISPEMNLPLEYDYNLLKDLFLGYDDEIKYDTDYKNIFNNEFTHLCMYEDGFICWKNFFEFLKNFKSHDNYENIKLNAYIAFSIYDDFDSSNLERIIIDNSGLFKSSEIDIANYALISQNIAKFKHQVDNFITVAFDPEDFSLDIESFNTALNLFKEKLVPTQNYTYEISIINRLLATPKPKPISQNSKEEIQFLYHYFYEHIDKFKSIREGIAKYFSLDGLQTLTIKDFKRIISGEDITLELFLSIFNFEITGIKNRDPDFAQASNEMIDWTPSLVKNIFNECITEIYLAQSGEDNKILFLKNCMRFLSGSAGITANKTYKMSMNKDIMTNPYPHTCFYNMDMPLGVDNEDMKIKFKNEFNKLTFGYNVAKKYIKLSDFKL